jgi:hypothetical protein
MHVWWNGMQLALPGLSVENAWQRSELHHSARESCRGNFKFIALITPTTMPAERRV